MSRTVLLTGAAGFLGSHVARAWAAQFPEDKLVVFDALTYAGNPANLAGVPHQFVRFDLADEAHTTKAFLENGPFDVVVHLAAETHVDRSIHSPATFVRTNVLGTQHLLDAARLYGVGRFLHVSTDEVYGSLAEGDSPVAESAAFRPSSPYAASKAGADCLVSAAHRTYGLPTLTVRPANCFGLRQFPEKLIPVLIRAALAGLPLPLYGDGLYQRDWLAAEDFAAAILLLTERGAIGQAYNVSGTGERTNLEIARLVCELTGISLARVRSVPDRPGHDRRYAVSGKKLAELGFAPTKTLESVLPAVVESARAAARDESRSG